MKPFFLIISYEDFKLKVANLINDTQQYLVGVIKGTIEEKNDIEGFRRKWEDEIVGLLRTSFSDEDNYLADNYKYIEISRLGIPNHTNNYGLYTLKYRDGIKLKCKYLQYLLSLIEISDYLLVPTDEVLIANMNLLIQDKEYKILEKLYRLRKKSHVDYIPIKDILETNFIATDSHDENFHLGKSLESNGFVDFVGFSNGESDVQITLAGVKYVESKLAEIRNFENRANSSHGENFNNSEIEELKKKIDSLIDDFKVNSFGSEILFEELQDLKSLITKVNKKNFGEVLKGKLVDLGIKEVLDIDNISYIFNQITGVDIKSIPFRDYIGKYLPGQ